MRVVEYRKRYVVQWFAAEISKWIDDKSFGSEARAKRYARKQLLRMPYHYRVLDIENGGEK